MTRTFKHIGNSTLKVDQGRVFEHSILAGNRKVLGLHEHDSMAVTVVVNVLQLLQDPGTVGTVVSV